MGCGASAETTNDNSRLVTANPHCVEVGPASPSTAVATLEDSRAGNHHTQSATPTNERKCSSSEDYRRALLVSPQPNSRTCEIAPHRLARAAPDSCAKSPPGRDPLLRCGRSHDGDGVHQALHRNDGALLTFVPTQLDVSVGKKSSDTLRPPLPNPHQSSEGVWQFSVMSGRPADSVVNAGSLAGYQGSAFAESGIVVDSTTLRGGSRTDTLLSGASESGTRANKNDCESPMTLAKFYAADDL